MGKPIRFAIAGFCAGAVAGLFGAGGGMVLVPLLTAFTNLSEAEIFPASTRIILPICLVTLITTLMRTSVDISTAIPYLLGGGLGGFLAGCWGKNVPVKWLHRGLGILILWGGFRYLC